MTDALISLLTAGLTGVTVGDGTLPRVDGPHVRVYDTGLDLLGRRLPGAARVMRDRWSLVCVSNTPSGARIVSDLVWRLLDGIYLGGDLFRVQVVHESIEDRDDPSEWRWSSTVELTRTHQR